MELKQIEWNDLGISNDFLFGKVMQNPGLCMELLKRILLELDIERIEYPELQKEIRPDADAKSIRLDVYVTDDRNTVYTIEMQACDTKELPKRSRYYQSMTDLQLIDRGGTYAKLNHSYVIFICLTDVFGEGRHIYTFENLCKEDTRIPLGDETTKIFLNASGVMNDVSVELKAFLDYVAGKDADDPYVRELDEAVKEAKKNRKWRHEYMTLLMRDRMNLQQGIEQGIEQGERMARISDIMELLGEFGTVPENISTRISSEQSMERLKSWLKLAARADSIESFRNHM